MPPATNVAFMTWLNSNNMTKLISNAVLVHINYEGITNFVSLTDFDNKIIESLRTTCKEKIPTITDDKSAGITYEPKILGSNIYSGCNPSIDC